MLAPCGRFASTLHCSMQWHGLHDIEVYESVPLWLVCPAAEIVACLSYGLIAPLLTGFQRS